MAEHLTSAAAVFHSDNQTKLTAWIRAGATASCGSVTEPYAIWEKFPTAHFYYHYASGSTMIESFYQSIKSPLQILLVGEPLAAPWAPRIKLQLDGIDDIGVKDKVVVRPRIGDRNSSFQPARFIYMLDDVAVHEGDSMILETDKLAPGEHRLRVIAIGRGLLGQQAFHEETFMVGKNTSAQGGN
jgi:hypothetical protein